MKRLRLYKIALCLACAAAQSFLAQSPTLHSSVDTLYAQAQDAQTHGDITGAIAKYEEILRVAPGWAAAYNNLGSLDFDAGKYQNAIDVLRKGLRIDPGMATSYAI